MSVGPVSALGLLVLNAVKSAPLTALLLLSACKEGPASSLAGSDQPLALQDSEKKLDHLTACVPTVQNFPSPLTSSNPYFPIAVDLQWTLEGEEDDVPVRLLLTMLDELGLAQLEASDGAKKLYALTDAGREELTAKRGEAEQLLGRLAAAKDRSSGGRAPQIVRAVENFRTALRLRLNRGPLSEDEIENIAAAIDSAAAAVERS